MSALEESLTGGTRGACIHTHLLQPTGNKRSGEVNHGFLALLPYSYENAVRNHDWKIEFCRFSVCNPGFLSQVR